MGLGHDPLEGLEVVVRAKQAHPPNGAVQDVEDVSAERFAGCSGHGSGSSKDPTFLSNKMRLRSKARPRSKASSPFPLPAKPRTSGSRIISDCVWHPYEASCGGWCCSSRRWRGRPHD
jgi:hypothetical protein